MEEYMKGTWACESETEARMKDNGLSFNFGTLSYNVWSIILSTVALIVSKDLN